MKLNMKKEIALFTCVFLISLSVFSQDYWKPILSKTNKDLYSISFGNEQIGYICGKDSLLLKTIDGGKSWNQIKPKGINFNQGGTDLIDVQFVNAQVGYMVQSNYKSPTYMGTLFKTTDGGINWTNINSVNVATYKSLYFSEDNGFIVGSAFFQGKTVCKQVNGSWQGVNSFSWSPQEFIRAIDFHDSLTGIVGGDSGYVYRTYDGGVNWDTLKIHYFHPIVCLKYISEQLILGATQGFDKYFSADYYSEDKGKTWVGEVRTFEAGTHPETREIIKSVRDSFIRIGAITYRNHGFIEWMKDDSLKRFYPSRPMNDASMKNDSIGFIVGEGGIIFCNGFSETSKIINLKNSVESIVFPNPTSSILNVSCNASFDFQLCTIEGRLLDEGMNCNPFYQIDVSKFTKGLYVLIVKLNGQQTEVFKVQVD